MLTSREMFYNEIAAFLDEMGITPTAFGRAAMGDPNFVFRLKEGRSPTTDTIDVCRRYMVIHRKRTARKERRGKVTSRGIRA